jgi:hypothetical protein
MGDKSVDLSPNAPDGEERHRVPRGPKLKKLTARTIAIASHNALAMKPPTVSPTTTGWSATRCASIPIGKFR